MYKFFEEVREAVDSTAKFKGRRSTQQGLRGQCHQNTRGWVVEVVGGNDGETIDRRLAIDAEHAGMCTLN